MEKVLIAQPIAFVLTAIVGWINHVIWSISTVLGSDPMTMNEGVIAIIGTFIPPLGAIHGVYLWF